MTPPAHNAAVSQRSVLAISAAWPWLLLALGWLVLSLDGDIFWDEPGYLYIAAYIGNPEFLAGTYQPAEIENFYLAKILHLLVVKAVVAVVGTGALGLGVIAALYAAFTVASLFMMHAVIRLLLPGDGHLSAAVALTALTPVMIYLVFKTLPEAPAVFLACLGLLAFIKSLRQPPAGWIVLAAVSLATMALLRHSLGLMLVGFVIAAFVLPPAGIDRLVLIKRAVVTALLSVLVWVAMLWSLGISVESFILATSLFWKEEPLLFKLVSIVLSLGALWLVVVVACWSSQRGLLAFFLTWFLLTTLPMPLLLSHVEPRYYIQNLPAFAGLAALTLGVLQPLAMRVAGWAPAARIALVAALLAVLLGSNWIGLRLSPAELNMWQIRSMVGEIREAYAGRDYTLLTSWTGTDFHYLRFVYPDLPVFNASDKYLLIQDGDASQEEMEDRYFQGRRVRTLEDLSRLDGELVYFGYDETFMVANARRFVNMVPGVDAERILPSEQFMNHLAQSWMWDHPDLQFTLIAEHGHYHAYRVERR